MAQKEYKGKIYEDMAARFPELIAAVDQLGATVRGIGPIDEKTSLLIQLAAAAAVGSEGSVHSHIRRAIQAGATPAEIHHTLLLLISTIGFPQAMAAISWSRDILEK